MGPGTAASHSPAPPPKAPATGWVFRNRCRSALAVVITFVGAALGGFGVGAAAFALTHRYYEPADTLWPGVYGGAVGLVAALLCVLAGRLFATPAVLRAAKAYPASPADDAGTIATVERLARQANVPAPAVCIMDDDALNAFSIGPAGAATLAITTGLRDKLEADEFACVIAHELTHIARGDAAFGLTLATTLGLLPTIADVAHNVIRAHRPRYKTSRSPGRKSTTDMALAWVVLCTLYVFAVPLSALVHLLSDRGREFHADAAAVELVGSPGALVSALNKLATQNAPLRKMNRGLAHLYTVNSLGQGQTWHDVDSPWRPHPPIRRRVERLLAMETR